MRRIGMFALFAVALNFGTIRAGGDKVIAVGKDPAKITGKIAEDDPKSKITEPNVNVTVELPAKVFQVKLKGGMKYRIDLVAPDLDPVLAVQDSTGKQLAFNDDITQDNLNSRVDFTAPADGTYKLVAASLKGAGDFTLTVTPAGGAAAGGASKDVKIEGSVEGIDDPVRITNADVDKKLGLIAGAKTIPLPAKMHEVKLDGGKRYQIDIVAKDKVDPIIVVQDSTGKQLGFDDDGGGFPNARFTLQTPKTDTYKIFAGTIGGQGKYVLTVKELGGAAPKGKEPIALEIGAKGLKVEGKLDGQTKFRPVLVKMEAGKTYVITMSSPDVQKLDPYLEVHSKRGNTTVKLAENDDISMDDLNSRIVFRAPESETGVFLIVARSFGAPDGDYTLEIRLQE